MSFRKMYLTACLIIVSLVYALPVERNTAEAVAESKLFHDGRLDDHSVTFLTVIMDDEGGSTLAYVFELNPAGYVIVGADDMLPPVIAYSYTDHCTDDRHDRNILFDIVRMDLIARLSSLNNITEEHQSECGRQWDEYITGDFVTLSPLMLEQWPPEGSTPTGGWLMENWTQSPPYNNYCPMDLNAGSRSVAGCPAVAMAAILNFQEEINSTRFDDSTDDYYHNFYESYWIDDDHVAHDFPSWPELNAYLDTLESHWDNSVPITSSDKAAIVFASGAACHQVYSASVSGTYGVGQAATAYQRFTFVDSELLYATSDSLYERLSQNMIDAMPAHFAIVDEGPTYGHNIVIDGYNTDDFYHFNFGWGGSYNGWYDFPLSGMPYGMNFIEGIILDIGEGPQGIEDGDTESGGMHLTLVCRNNPVLTDLSISIALQQSSHVNLAIYSITGRLVGTLADREFNTGSHEFNWNSDGSPSGVYIVRAMNTQGMVSEKITVLK
ncbi:MAG: thiol protease/hemagglutinin PrtT [Candidatus Aegiribacteria sp.]|nr:thiol protease/hemagglutinin PrtT [Candidatus Aegiribacteria sp.]